MGTLFEDLRDGLRDGIDFIVDKTDEMSKIGKLKIDMLSTKRNIEKLFTELGGDVYEKLSGRKKVDLQTDEGIKKMIADIKELEKSLDEKKNEIKKIKQEKEDQRKTRGEERQQKTAAKKSEEPITDVDIVDETEDKKE
ncbi:hypothetical protein JW992_00005 [candidate division KSB1 bacterium]|nr:hypothetical protein [candidate division KSB1 bacterium]